MCIKKILYLHPCAGRATLNYHIALISFQCIFFFFYSHFSGVGFSFSVEPVSVSAELTNYKIIMWHSLSVKERWGNGKRMDGWGQVIVMQRQDIYTITRLGYWGYFHIQIFHFEFTYKANLSFRRSRQNCKNGVMFCPAEWMPIFSRPAPKCISIITAK